MIRGASVRRVYESFCKGGSNIGGLDGPAGFHKWLMVQCGHSVDRMGRQRVSRVIESGDDKGKSAIDPAAISIRDLAEGIIGEEWVRGLDPMRTRRTGLPTASQLQAFESATLMVGPGSFPNTSAWVSSVSGLLELKALESFDNPEYEATKLVTIIPTGLRSNKMAATARIGDQAQVMVPGQPHPRVGLTERYVRTPETQKRGLGIDILKETVFYNLTGDVMTRAASIGDELALNRDKRLWRVILGIDNPYNYNDVAYNTYTTSGVVINKLVAPLVDWTDLNEAATLASRMTDQESGERIATTYNKFWCMPGRIMSARSILQATETEQRTNSSAEIRRSSGSMVNGTYEIVASPIAEQVLIDSGVAAATALEYWGLVNSNKAFAYMENWGIVTETPSANDYEMADKGIIFSQFVDESGAAAVLERRYAIEAVPN
jgi:hypothetical protein